MSSEHRENRPFKAIPQLDALLAQMKLYVGDQVVQPDSSAVVSDDVFLHSPFVLRLAADETVLRETVQAALSAVEASPYEATDLALVVVASSPYLKIAEVLAVVELPEMAELPASRALTGPVRPKAMQSARSGCEIEVAICLNKTREFKPLEAWRRWSWLSLSRFGVGTEAALGGFVPLPLDAAKRTEFGLPNGTMRYILIDNDVSVTSPDSSEDSLQLYVDADLLALMSVNDKGSNSKYLQRLLFIDAVWVVVNHALLVDDIVDLTPDDIKGSLLDKVLHMAAGPSATTTQITAMLDLMREKPADFMARIEHRVDVLGAAHELVGGTQ
jgi:hypothetical protein